MKYSNLTTDSKFFIKRFSHEKRFEKAYCLLSKQNTKSVLDFGTGDGYFLHYLNKKKTIESIKGYEPVEEIYKQIKLIKGIEVVKKTSELHNEKFDAITCLEVLEHFNQEKQRELLQEIRSLLAPGGRIIISVPIEIGLSSLLKNGFRVLFKQREKDTSYKNIYKALFIVKVNRSQKGDYINSHIGFNYKKLEELILKEGFIIDRKEFSPIGFLRSFINSQVFYVLKNK